MWLTFTFAVVMTTAVAVEIPITRPTRNGFRCDICRTMPQAVNGWTAHILFSLPVVSIRVRGARLLQRLDDGKDYLIANGRANAKVGEGEQLCFNFTAKMPEGSPDLPTVSFYIDGVDALPTWDLQGMPDPLAPFKPESTGRFDEGSVSIVDDPAGVAGRVLRVFYRQGHYVKIKPERGAQFYSTPTAPSESMMLSYDLYFSPGYDFVRGGKLPGLFGGFRNCSGGRLSDQCFSTRLMWRSEGDGEVYAYIPQEQAPGLCDQPNNVCNPQFGTSLGRGNWRFQVGQWQTIAQRVTLNTPGQFNGRVEVWHDGQKVLDINNLNIRTRSDLQIEGLFFSTFFGGSDDSWAPSADCFTYYKNFVISG